MLDRDEARAIVASHRPPFGTMQLAMRRAYGVSGGRARRRRRGRTRKRGRRPYEPTDRELEECRRQTHGVDVDG